MQEGRGWPPIRAKEEKTRTPPTRWSPRFRTKLEQRTVVFRLMCLPFLPFEDIGPTFEIISNPLGWDVLPHDVDLSLGRFVRYVKRMWIDSAMGQERWKVWSTDIRTNNSVEAYNARLNAKLPPHPNVYQLVEFLSKEIKKTRIRSIMASMPGKKFRPQAKKQREKEARVDEDKAREGHVQAIQYLDQIVSIYHPVTWRKGSSTTYGCSCRCCSCGRCGRWWRIGGFRGRIWW